jgi:hypothetical protein
MQAVIGAGADIVCIETMSDVNEARLAVRAARSVSASIPVMATMTFEATPRGFFTIMGVSIASACRELEEAGADLVGSNCGNGSAQMIAIAGEFKKHSRLPLVIQPNAGVPELRHGQVHYPETPEFMAAMAGAWLDAGVAVIGGCCGTTPDHTVAMPPQTEIEQATLESERVAPEYTGSIATVPAGAVDETPAPSAPSLHRLESILALAGVAAILLFFLASLIERLLREPTGLELLELERQRELAAELAEQRAADALEGGTEPEGRLAALRRFASGVLSYANFGGGLKSVVVHLPASVRRA